MKLKEKDQLIHFKAIRILVGEKIKSIYNNQYYFNGEPDADDCGDVELTTKSGIHVCLFLLGDAESVGAYVGELEIPEPFDVGDSEQAQASWRKEKVFCFSQLAGEKVVAVEAMYDCYTKLNYEYISGWRICLSNGNYLIFYNCGDEAKLLLNETPSDYSEEIEVRWERI